MRDIDTLTRTLYRTRNRLDIATRSLDAKKVEIEHLKAKMRDMEIEGRESAKEVWYVNYLMGALSSTERAFDNLNNSVDGVIAKNKELEKQLKSIHVL